MESVKIFIDGIQKDVYGLFYIYNSKYYFIYTEKEIDEKDYVLLYMTQVAKETKQTENGVVDTGFMVGMEIVNPEEQKEAQSSISYIVEDKKNNIVNSQIKYLPISMLLNLKIISKKRFRLLKSIMINNFKINFDDVVSSLATNVKEALPSIVPDIDLSQSQGLQPLSELSNIISVDNIDQVKPQEKNFQSTSDNNIIIDYRTKYFEEEAKNKELQGQINELTKKLEEIKKVLE